MHLKLETAKLHGPRPLCQVLQSLSRFGVITLILQMGKQRLREVE